VRNTQRRELAVCGLEAVRAVVAVRPGSVRRFFYSADRAREFGSFCGKLAAGRRPYRLVEAAELEKLCGTAHHQGVVAMVDDLPPAAVTDTLVAVWARSGARVAVLDRVGDDHNLGSIARSAAFFGWTALVIGRDDGAARLSTSAYRVARGALEHIPVYADDSAARFAARCKGMVATVGADHNGSRSLREYRSQLHAAVTSPGTPPAGSAPPAGLALILGNEETGLSPAVRASCAELVRIDGAGLVESLNVSQAAAVLLYELAPPIR
jgi:RNA methyltransferase, TrmH family